MTAYAKPAEQRITWHWWRSVQALSLGSGRNCDFIIRVFFVRKNPGMLKFDWKVQPSYDQDSLASSGFSLSIFFKIIFKSYKLPSSLTTMQVPKVWLFAAIALFHHLPSSNRSSFSSIRWSHMGSFLFGSDALATLWQI